MNTTVLKRLRNAAKLTQEQVAEKLEVSTNTVQNWESGRNKIGNKKLHKLLDLYEVDSETRKRVVEELYGQDPVIVKPKTYTFPENLFEPGFIDTVRKFEALELNMEEMDILVYCYWTKDKAFFNKKLELRDRTCKFEYTFFQAHGGMSQALSKIQKLDQKLEAIPGDVEDTEDTEYTYRFLYNWSLNNPNSGFILSSQPQSFIKDFFRKFMGIDFLKLFNLCARLSQPTLVKMPYEKIELDQKQENTDIANTLLQIKLYDPRRQMEEGIGIIHHDFMEGCIKDRYAATKYYKYNVRLPQLYKKCFIIEQKESTNEEYLLRKSGYLLYQKEMNAYLADPQTYVKKHIDEYMDKHIGKYLCLGIDNPPKFVYLYDAELSLTEYGQNYLKWALSDSFICSDEIKKMHGSLQY